MKNVCDTICDFVKIHPVQNGCYVGFSGGIDSTALLLALHKAGANPIAVHYEHGIRGEEALEDCMWCKNFCKSRGIKFIGIHLDVLRNMKHGEATEEAARRMRMENWKRLCSNDAKPVFLAHHEDDAIEDLFLRLARGSNVNGIIGMKEEREINGVTYFRPFLSIRKESLKEYITSNGVLDWRTDSTNLESDYRRNAVRNRLLPLFREIFGNDGGLRTSLEVLREDASFIDSEVKKYVRNPSGISAKSWIEMPSALVPRVFRGLLKNFSGEDVVPRKSFLNELMRKIKLFKNVADVQMNSKTIVHLTKKGMTFKKV